MRKTLEGIVQQLRSREKKILPILFKNPLFKAKENGKKPRQREVQTDIKLYGSGKRKEEEEEEEEEKKEKDERCM